MTGPWRLQNPVSPNLPACTLLGCTCGSQQIGASSVAISRLSAALARAARGSSLMKRLGYRKSRNGCLLCKKRRVKCDEQRPCSACVRHGVSCSLEGSGGAGGTEGSSAPKPVSSLRSSPRTLSRVNSPSSVSSDAPKPASLPPSTSSSSSKQGISPGAFGDVDLNVSFLHASPSEPTGTPQALEYGQPALIDLELMHHYTAHAYRSFPHTSTVPDFFQTNVPRLALRHRFLLHQTLAIAAFHLMHVTPDLPPEYFQRATHHLTKALSGIRAALTAEMTFESGKALFAASSLLLSSTYASRQHLPADGIIDDLIGMVALYHGTSSIQRIAVEKLSKNLFHEVFGDQLHEPAAIEPWLSEYTSELKVLKSYILAAPDLPGNVRSAALHGTQILLDSTWTLTEADRAIPSTVETLILYRWPFWAADDYLQLVRQREPAALATLIFYSAIMRRAEEKCWFLKGWAARIAEAATEFLEGTPWALYTRWAFRVIETGS